MKQKKVDPRLVPKPLIFFILERLFFLTCLIAFGVLFFLSFGIWWIYKKRSTILLLLVQAVIIAALIMIKIIFIVANDWQFSSKEMMIAWWLLFLLIFGRVIYFLSKELAEKIVKGKLTIVSLVVQFL